MNAQEIIREIEKLPPDEKKVVFEFVETKRENISNTTHYSPEIMSQLDQDQDDCEKGINIEEYSSMTEARKALGLTE